MDYKLNQNNYIDIYCDKIIPNNIIIHEFNIRDIMNDNSKCINFKYKKNTILICKTNDIKLYYHYIHSPSGYHVEKNIYNNDILILNDDKLLEIYKDIGNENINDYDLDNLIIYEIKNIDNLNFTIITRNENFDNYIYDFEINLYAYDNIYSNIDRTSIIHELNFIEIYDRGYSTIIYKLIFITNIDIIDKYIKIKTFDIILYYKVKKISQKKYELILNKIYHETDNIYYDCNFYNLIDYNTVDKSINKIKYFINNIETFTNKSIKKSNMSRPLDASGRFTWYYNFNNILIKYKIHNDVIFYNLSWLNEFSK